MKMIRCLFFLSLLIHATLAAKGGKKADEASSKKWLTLNGGEPVVIARGGFSGLFPESCQFANKMGISMSLPSTILFCNLQMTKDAVGFCLTDIRLDNSTNIAEFFPKGKTTYKVNGQNVKSWFAVDYTMDQLYANVSLIQNVYSRPNLFDGILPISTVEDALGVKPPQFWINIQYPTFYDEHKISVQKYLEEGVKPGAVNYISSPEIGFLKSMSGKAGKAAKVKLVFVFLDPDAIEPTTKKTYSEILKDLNTVKSFASGIVVPKNYIWPVNNKTKYLDAPTTLVTDAHKLGLEVYASGFANDMIGSYNYSYDPSVEYLQFIDNSQFAVDGFLTDFPPTASEAIACFAQNNNTKPSKGQALIISSEGASGVYPGSTDLAYQQAINDGADIIDCSVQMSKDGVAFCMGSADLVGRTTAMTSFMSRSTSVPEIQPKNGIFSFDLTWTEIQTLKPEFFTVYGEKFPRNPAAKNQGKFVTLDGFLELAKSKGASGIMIDIENVPYLASKKGLDMIDTVIKALKNATFDKQSTQQVLIASEDTTVLSKFADFKTYKRVWRFEQKVSTATNKSIDEIKKHADAVIVPRFSIITNNENGFTESYSNIVKELQTANITVYVSSLRNEYTSYAFDYFSDPILQVAAYVAGAGVDGVLTEYPATASRYMRSPCSDIKKNQNMPYPILPSEPGGLLALAPEEAQPPATAPAPALDVADIVDPPLPPVATTPPPSTAPTNGAPAGTTPPPSSGMANVANIGLSMVAIMVFSFLSM